MLLNFFLYNFLPLMLLLSLTVMLIINKKLAVPATGYFYAGILLQLILTVSNTANSWAENQLLFPEQQDQQYRVLVITSVLSYVLRPVIIMIIAFIVIPERKYRLPCSIPALLNAFVYSYMGSESHADILMDKQHPWHKSIIGFTIYYTEIFYLFLLMFFTIVYFKWDQLKRSAIVLLICIQSVLVAVLEETGLVTGYADAISAACMLEYYFYLSLIYQSEMQNMISQKELMLAQQKTSLLRTQIHPHFILNSLSIIRSLVKRDPQKAVACIDAFADYLNVHIRAINFDDIIDFEEELRHVKAYLSLVLADTARQIDIRYDLKTTDFKLPPLTLEPLIENAVKYGTGKENGYICISTLETEEGVILISVEDSGSDIPPTEKSKESTGVGINNTRLRLALQCGGSLTTEQKPDGGMTATIQIPKLQEVSA